MWCSLGIHRSPSPSFAGNGSAASNLLSGASGWIGTAGRWCRCNARQLAGGCHGDAPMIPGNKWHESNICLDRWSRSLVLNEKPVLWTGCGLEMEKSWLDSISHLQDVQTGSGAHPASYSVGSLGSFLGVKRLGREANHSHLIPGLRMNGAVRPQPPLPLWHSQRQLYYQLCLSQSS